MNTHEICVFKIIKHKYDYKGATELIYNISKVTRGNDWDKIAVIIILGNFRSLIEF